MAPAREIFRAIPCAILTAVFAVPLAAQGPGQIHKWTFNGHEHDTAGTAHGKLQNGAKTVGGRLVLDGLDDYVGVAPQASLGFTAAYTVQAWIKSTGSSTDYRVIFIRGTQSANDIEVYIQRKTNHLIVAHNRNNNGTFDYAGFVPPPTNSWFHLAVTFDGSTVHAYYDGVDQSIVQRDRSLVRPLYTNKPVEIGRTLHSAFRQSMSHFRGEIDEIRIHDQALSPLWVNLSRRIGPVRAGTFVTFGQGCGGVHSPALVVNESVCPTLGDSFSIELQSTSANVPAFLFTGVSTTKWGQLQLPMSLGSIAPGCRLYTSIEILTLLRTDSMGRAKQTVPVPNEFALLDFEFHNQWSVVSTTANSLGLVLSNAGTARIGLP